VTEAMETQPIEIPSDIRDAIVRHAIDGLPNEACGVLAGPDGQIVHFFPMANADESPLTYRLEATEQLRVWNEIDDKGWEVRGIVHSHTHTEAYPSETDRRQAFLPDAWYVLVSLMDLAQPAIRGFSIRDGDVLEREVVIR
jgi:[CysO sulfur-carrier protein]-S-L-cysteine hydrolase